MVMLKVRVAVRDAASDTVTAKLKLPDVEGYRWKLGGGFPIGELERSVPRRLAWLEKNGYQYDTYLLMASAGDNIQPIGAFHTLERIREWNRKHAELPMKMALPEEFFDRLIEKYGDRFPSASGDAAGHWETVKLKVPAVVGVPETAPSAERESPAGAAPDHRYGGVPPEAVSDCE